MSNTVWDSSQAVFFYNTLWRIHYYGKIVSFFILLTLTLSLLVFPTPSMRIRKSIRLCRRVGCCFVQFERQSAVDVHSAHGGLSHSPGLSFTPRPFKSLFENKKAMEKSMTFLLPILRDLNP